ncbi:MAG: nitroreductase family protein [Candidatus Promineifilaceae bacterium]
MNILEALHNKHAVRTYLDKPIPQEAINTILNAGRLAQSAKNLQPWHFLAIQDRERLKQLVEAGNFSNFLGSAALGVVILTPDPNERFQIMFDAGQAAAYMQLAALELGIGSCLTTSYDREGAREFLQAPPEWHIRIAIGFGYPLPGELIRPPRQGKRNTFDEIVHWEQWDTH